MGHATASVSEAKRLVQEDFSILTSYLESGFVAGDEELLQRLAPGVFEELWRAAAAAIPAESHKYREARLQQYGETSYLLEPHVKEGVGGLRDLHIIRWAGMVFLHDTDLDAMMEREWLARQEVLWLEQAYDFLWRVRLQLHQLTGRRQDQLLFPEQELVAARLGYSDSQQGLAVEAFMRLYYRHTARIRRTTTFFLERLEENGREISPPALAAAASCPALFSSTARIFISWSPTGSEKTPAAHAVLLAGRSNRCPFPPSDRRRHSRKPGGLHRCTPGETRRW